MIRALDHLVLTVASVEATVAFYEKLGLRHVTFDGRHALHFGKQKINLHEAGAELQPKALHPTPGSGDLCFLIDGQIEAAQAALSDADIAIEEGPVPRTGASGPITSLYIRDPDQNLIELSVPR